MKKQFLSVAAIVALAAGVASCSNNASESATNDSTTSTTESSSTTSTGTTSMSTSTGSYAALADTVERNSEQGYYLNPKTGKPYGKLTVDRNTGYITTEAGEPVWRYVDNRNWWVYGDRDINDTLVNWEHVADAEMRENRLRYKGDGDKWVDYDTRWKKDDGDTKIKTEDAKIKQEADGDLKIKTKDGKKLKVDEDGVKTKE
jgi:hypothetical protein